MPIRTLDERAGDSLPFTRLTIFGLHGSKNVDIDFKSDISIFIGPNGIGKSTILNIFVHFLACQWDKLRKNFFDSVTVIFKDGSVASASRQDCLEFSQFGFSSQLQEIMSAPEWGNELLLSLENGTDIFSKDSLLRREIPLREWTIFRNNLSHSTPFRECLTRLATAGNAIKRNFDRKIVYLPTYRRIDQELNDLLASSGTKYPRARDEFSRIMDENSNRYTEFVRFGMEDIKQTLIKYASDIKEYSRQQINSLSTRFLSAAFGKKKVDRNFFNSLSDEKIAEVLSRVDETELNEKQRTELVKLISSIRPTAVGRLTSPQEHIARYFPMLAETHEIVSRRERPLRDLATIFNRYINPEKRARYDSKRYEFYIENRFSEIPLSGLSSGEKQIVALFTSLALSEEKNIFVVIDEPELSLSVLWQEILIKDIMKLDSCRNIIAVTHSPFIYGDDLLPYTRDLGDFTKLAEIV